MREWCMSIDVDIKEVSNSKWLQHFESQTPTLSGSEVQGQHFGWAGCLEKLTGSVLCWLKELNNVQSNCHRVLSFNCIVCALTSYHPMNLDKFLSGYNRIAVNFLHSFSALRACFTRKPINWSPQARYTFSTGFFWVEIYCHINHAISTHKCR